MGYGTRVRIPGSNRIEFALMSPGPVIENIRGIPNRTAFRNRFSDNPHIFAVDPNVHWANPNAMEAVEPPFAPFPPGCADAQSPMEHVTHTHGLVVAPQFDGTAEEWFDDAGHRGPSFVSSVYEQPNQQPGTQLFYHDHVMGVTRLNVMGGPYGVCQAARRGSYAGFGWCAAGDPDRWCPARREPVPGGCRVSDQHGHVHVCEPIERLASSGITEDAVHFVLADGDTFRPATRSCSRSRFPHWRPGSG